MDMLMITIPLTWAHSRGANNAVWSELTDEDIPTSLIGTVHANMRRFGTSCASAGKHRYGEYGSRKHCPGNSNARWCGLVSRTTARVMLCSSEFPPLGQATY